MVEILVHGTSLLLVIKIWIFKEKQFCLRVEFVCSSLVHDQIFPHTSTYMYTAFPIFLKINFMRLKGACPEIVWNEFSLKTMQIWSISSRVKKWQSVNFVCKEKTCFCISYCFIICGIQVFSFPRDLNKFLLIYTFFQLLHCTSYIKNFKYNSTSGTKISMCLGKKWEDKVVDWKHL